MIKRLTFTNRLSLAAMTLLFYLCLLFYIFPAAFASDLPDEDLQAVQTARQGTVLPEGDDYATVILGDPWDMGQISDIYNEKTQNMSDVSVENGILSGVSLTDDPSIFMLWPGFVGGLPSVGKYGVNFPIDANQYTHLSFRMYLSQEGQGEVFWYEEPELTSGNYGSSVPFRVYEGWRVYTLDLSQIERMDGNLDWGGLIQGLRLDPASLPGTEIKIDWIRLTASNTPATLYPLSWNTTYSDSVVNLYSDTDQDWANGYYSPIVMAHETISNPNIYTWQSAPLPAGEYFTVSEVGIDYASLTFDNPWDMNEESDVGFFRSVDHVTFTNGVLSFTTSNEIPHFWPSYDHQEPIDSSKYDRLVMRMYSSEANGWRFSWWGTDENPYDFNEEPLPTVAGWYTYTLDLSQHPDWSNEIRNLVIRPAFTSSLEIKIDWIALTSGPEPQSEQELGVERRYSSKSFTITQAPLLHVTKPSMNSGEDYATTVLGNPWDMNNNQDLAGTLDLFDINFNGDRLNTRAGALNDAQLFLNTGSSGKTAIDTSRYKYLTYRMYVEGKQDTIYGWVSRLIWFGSQGPVTHRDIVINEGWNTYEIDLSESPVEEGASSWQGFVSMLRFDPQEIPVPTDMSLDYVYLRAPDEADQSFDITWQAEFQLDTQVDLYFDTDTDATNKTLIASNLSAQALTYTWDTSAVPEGSYYIYLVAKDDYNSIGRYSKTPVVIKHSTTVKQADMPVTQQIAPLPMPALSAAEGLGKGASSEPTYKTYNNYDEVNDIAAEGPILWVATRGGVIRWNTDDNSSLQYTTADGLVNNVVYSVAIDQDGNKWFGTRDGISRFDGTNWSTFTTEQGLADNRVYDIAIDSMGNKWFGTAQGLSKFDGNSWTTYTTAQGLADNIVRAIALDRTNQVWVGTDGGGISRFDGTNWTSWAASDGLVNNHVWSITADSTNNIWIGTYEGLSRFDGNTWTTYTMTQGLGANYVRDVVVDSAQNIWVATIGGGVSHLNNGTWQTYTMTQGLFSNNVTALAEDATGKLWTGSTGGLSEFSNSSWITHALTSPLADNFVTSIAKDHQGHTWVGTYHGAARFDGQTWQHYTTADGLVSNRVQDIMQDHDQNMWFATDNGISRFDGTNWTTFTTYNTNDGLFHNNATAITVDNEGKLWFGTWLGVSIFDGTTWVSHSLGDGLEDQYVYDIEADQNGAVWVGSLAGVKLFENNLLSKTYTMADGLSDNRIRAITIDRAGNKWFGTFNGVSRFDGTNWTSWSTEQGLSNNVISAAAVDGSGKVWMGTYGGGLSIFDGQQWTTVNTSNGLSSNYVFAILLAFDEHWFGTFNGVSVSAQSHHVLYLPLSIR